MLSNPDQRAWCFSTRQAFGARLHHFFSVFLYPQTPFFGMGFTSYVRMAQLSRLRRDRACRIRHGDELELARHFPRGQGVNISCVLRLRNGKDDGA